MSAKSSLSSKTCPPSRIPRLKKHVPSNSSSSPLVSFREHSRSPEHVGKMDILDHHADVDPSPPPAAHRSHLSSVRSVSARSRATANRMSANPPPGLQCTTNQLGGSSGQNYSSRHLRPSSLPQLSRGQSSMFQGPSHRANLFSGAHDFIVRDSMFIESNTSTDNFMEKLLHETITGVEFDSSDRDPPPRCHPGTRLAIIQRCRDFIVYCQDEGKLRWVVGPAGVGKSAVLQMVTETAPEGVVFTSIFLSVNGRREGKKTFITIAYQFAVKSGPYREFIRDQISLDPSLLRKSMSVQFNKLIVEPFMHKHVFDPSRRFLVVIDGLDECDDPLTQRKLLELITNFCITYPTSPIAWIIASRPEPQITSFFDNPDVRPAYTKEEMVIDSDEACDDAQRYLREELKKIKLAHPTLRRKREWPLEHEFTTIASAAGGLFAYAVTVIRYIGDSTRAGPATQLRRVLETINAPAKAHRVGGDNPMDQLDALYKRILSNVPDNVMLNTRKLLLVLPWPFFGGLRFRGLCNALGLTEDDGYDAISPLHAVLKIPEPDKADDNLSYYHKSFNDFLFDFERSGFSQDFGSESYQLCNHTSLKLMEKLQDDPDGAADIEDIKFLGGAMKDHCGNIALSWPGDDRFQMTDGDMRSMLYRVAMQYVLMMCNKRDDLVGNNVSCFHWLTTRFTTPTTDYPFPFSRLRGYAFDQFRNELTKLGKLKQVPLRTLDYAAVCGDVDLRFTSSIGSNIAVVDPWNASCDHVKQELDSLEQQRGWSTEFKRYYGNESGNADHGDIRISQCHAVTLQQGHQEWVRENMNRMLGGRGSATVCGHCSQRFARHFMDNQDRLAMVFVDATGMSYVEVSFVDPDDGVSEWRYRFLHSGAPTSTDV